MKVRELIEALEGEDQEAEVHVAYNYGDHSHTTVAPTVSYADSGHVRYSDYHSMPMVVDDEDDSKEGKQAVILFT